MNLAPIVMFTYTRLDHTIETINALKKNKMAKESDLIIYSDGPKNHIDSNLITELRHYLRNINGFKSIRIIESETNKGLAKSVKDGVTEVLEKFDKIIVLEDDLITSEYFLDYMNNSLEIYKFRDDIWSISGYTPPVKFPDNYSNDIYITMRGSSWGWATWKNRWDLVDWEIKDYSSFIKDKVQINKFNENGSDLTPMLKECYENRLDSWAIIWNFSQFNKNMWTVYPSKSFVRNIGIDLSGTNSSLSKKFDIKLNENSLLLNKDIKSNTKIIQSFSEVYNLNVIQIISVYFRRTKLYKPLRVFRNNILKRVHK